MEARTWRFGTHVLLAWLAVCSVMFAAERFETANFIVIAEDADVARQVGLAAEQQRKALAVYWLKKAMPNWGKPCRVSVNVGSMGAGGQTTFQFINGEVINWRMSVQGSLERILDSVLPHEINHTIFASHFRRPLPRWADEGAATLFEHNSEQRKQLYLLNQVIHRQEDYFALQELLSMKEYPQDATRMLTMYAQGYTLADFLVQQKGQYTWLKFLEDGETVGWEEAIRKHYDHQGVRVLERNWRGWVLAGMPRLKLPESATSDTLLVAMAQPDHAVSPPVPNLPVAKKRKTPVKVVSAASVIRSQSPEATDESETSTAAAVTTAQAKLTQPQPSPPTTSVTSAETSASNPVASTTVAAAPVFRHKSLEAPRPQRRSPGPSAPSSGPLSQSEQPATTRDATESPQSSPAATWFEETRPATSSPSKTSVNQPGDWRRPRTSAAGAADHFVPTGFSTVDSDGAVPADQRPPVNLPGERTGGTRPPQWAGFPGQMKLF